MRVGVRRDEARLPGRDREPEDRLEPVAGNLDETDRGGHSPRLADRRAGGEPPRYGAPRSGAGPTQRRMMPAITASRSAGASDRR